MGGKKNTTAPQRLLEPQRSVGVLLEVDRRGLDVGILGILGIGDPAFNTSSSISSGTPILGAPRISIRNPNTGNPKNAHIQP